MKYDFSKFYDVRLNLFFGIVKAIVYISVTHTKGNANSYLYGSEILQWLRQINIIISDCDLNDL